MQNPPNKKEKQLVKGAIRRVFSRSELRKLVMEQSKITYTDPNRPRVKKWSKCPECKQLTPTYLMEVDHILPVVGLSEKLEDLSWDTLIDRVWCSIDNLKAICKVCHKIKSKAEQKERRRLKKERMKNE